MILDIGERTGDLVQVNRLVNACRSYDVFDADERLGLRQMELSGTLLRRIYKAAFKARSSLRYDSGVSISRRMSLSGDKIGFCGGEKSDF